MRTALPGRWMPALITALTAAGCSLLVTPLGVFADEARQLYLTGKYAEAAEAYRNALEGRPVDAAIGLARCDAAVGRYDDTARTLDHALDSHPESSRLHAERARLALLAGQFDTARRAAEQAIEHDADSLPARWVLAELMRLSGDLAGADAAYEWLVEFYNATDQALDAESIHSIALAAAQFARWNRLSDQFTLIVQELYPRALQVEPNYWPARYEAGLLFLEKYNEADAAKELGAALAINPHSADVLAALAQLAVQQYDLDKALKLAERAIQIHPRHLEAHLALADIHLADFRPDLALQVLEEFGGDYPHSEPRLGRLAASYGLLDAALEEPAGTRMGQVIDGVLRRNPHAGDFYFALATSLDKCRRFPDAARYFARATEVMPQLVGPRGQQGMMAMRLGNEDTARKLLEESFAIDPFNVRVSNSLKVLEVLDTYETLETEHFLIRFDPKKDRVFALCAATYLEEIFPKHCETLAFQPPQKALIEVFNAAKNTDGHGWFSARMVGLPNIHTIGACAGKMVALTSPTATPQKFNWARVLKHELVHLINLQQTNFNIPHWYTEALAVLMEEGPRPAEWDQLLAERVPAGKVFNLDSINMGFIRPHTSDDWQMAYCQAELYAQYMLDAFGNDALARMLDAYADNLNTRDAIERSFQVTQQQFEAGYSAHLNKVAAGISANTRKAPALKFAELKKAHDADPQDAEAAARLAAAYCRRGRYAQAGPLVDGVLAKDPRHPAATCVKARLHIVIGQPDQAREILEASLDRNAPHLDGVRLLAGLYFKAGQWAEAEQLYRLGSEQEPANLQWVKSLAMVHLKSGAIDQLVPALTRLAEADPDELLVRKKLAQLAVQAQDDEAAARWANQAIQIDVMDLAMHRVRAEALARLGHKIDPNHAKAKSLLESLEK